MGTVWQALYVHCHLIFSTTLQDEYYDVQVKTPRPGKAKWLGLCLMLVNDEKVGIWTFGFMAKPTCALLPPSCRRTWSGSFRSNHHLHVASMGKGNLSFNPPPYEWIFGTRPICQLRIIVCQINIEIKWICLAVVLKLPFQCKSRINGGES